MKRIILFVLVCLSSLVLVDMASASSRWQKPGINYHFDPTIDDLFGVKGPEIGISVILTKRTINKPESDGKFVVEYQTEEGLRILSEQCGNRKPILVKVRKKTYAHFIGVIALSNDGPIFRVTDPDLTNCSNMIELDDPSSNQLLGFLGKGKISITSKINKAIVPKNIGLHEVYNVEYITKEGLHIYAAQCGRDPIVLTTGKHQYAHFIGVVSEQKDGRIVLHEARGYFSNCR